MPAILTPMNSPLGRFYAALTETEVALEETMEAIDGVPGLLTSLERLELPELCRRFERMQFDWENDPDQAFGLELRPRYRRKAMRKLASAREALEDATSLIREGGIDPTNPSAERMAACRHLLSTAEEKLGEVEMVKLRVMLELIQYQGQESGHFTWLFESDSEWQGYEESDEED